MSEQPHHILVVDDSALVLDTFADFLDREGFRTFVAESGGEGLSYVAGLPIDLVILDVQMPGMSGLDVLKVLRQLYSPDELPIVMATALGGSDDVVKAFDLGADDYVIKPVDPAEVVARVRSQLRSRSPAAERRRRRGGLSPWAGIASGTVLDGKYRMQELIGEGQFGAVYRASHLELERPVAVKMLHTSAGEDERQQARFHREAMSTCRVRHPNAVEVLDFSFTDHGIPYLAMELLEGRSLREELDAGDGRLALPRCVEILLPVCDVLAEAHACGVIHRDVKPQNVFLQRRREVETVKVVDFGLAKLVCGAVMRRRLTLDGVGPGTPLYMAPERFCDLPCDGRSDVYSVGVLLYEMLAGRPPFLHPEGNAVKVAMMHLNDRPRPIRELVAGLPAAVEELVLETLAKDPDERPSIEDLAGRLAAFEPSRSPAQSKVA
jgi:serine/threonine protein kinase